MILKLQPSEYLEPPIEISKIKLNLKKSEIAFLFYWFKEFEFLENDLDYKNLSKKILFDDIAPEAVEAIKKPTFNNVNILAMQHADAIIKGQSSYSPELEKAFEAFEKPILEWDQEDDYMDAYADFYDSIVDVESSIFAD